MEELLLRPLFAGQELDVIEEKRIDSAIAITKRLHLVVANRGNEFCDERVGGHVDDFHPRTDLTNLLPDGLDQMGLTEARATVDE